MYPVLTLCLGFREKGGIITQMNNFAPIGWENLSTVPDFGELNDEEIAQRMAKDIPEDEGGTGKFIYHA